MKVLLGIIKMPHLHFIIVQTKQIRTFSGQFINFFGNPKSSWGRGCVEKKPKSTGFFYTEYLEEKVQRKEKFFFFLKKNELIFFIVFVLID